MFFEELRQHENLGDHWLSLFRTSHRPIVIFGCGIVGQKRMKALQDEGVTVSAFVDNAVQRAGSLFMGLPVLSFAALETQYRNAFVLVASRVHRKAMFAQLFAAGFTKEQVTDIELSFYGQAKQIREQAAHYAALCDKVLAHLGDTRSKQLFLCRLRYLLSLDNTWMEDQADATLQYFDTNVFESDTFVGGDIRRRGRFYRRHAGAGHCA